MKRSIKEAARKGQRDVCVILAKEMIQSKKAVSKLYASKAQMNSVLLSMKNQLCEYLRNYHCVPQQLWNTHYTMGVAEYFVVNLYCCIAVLCGEGVQRYGSLFM